MVQSEGTVKADQGTVAYDQVQLAYCHIVAPITGQVGLAAGGPREHRLLRQQFHACGDHAIAADYGCLQRVRRQSAPGPGAVERRTQAAGGRLQPLQRQADRIRKADLAGQPGGHHDRDDQIPRRVSQQESRSLSQPVCERPPAGEHAAQRHPGPVRRRAAQRHRRVCLYCATQQHGHRAADHHADQQRTGHRRAGSQSRASIWPPADSIVWKTARKYRCADRTRGNGNSGSSIRAPGGRSGSSAHESLPAIYPAPGRNLSADGCDLSGGRRGVPAASGLGAARGGLPDDPGAHLLSRSQSGRGCLRRDRSAGAAVRRRSPDSAR